MNKKIYLTQQGIEDLKKEYHAITKLKRPEVLERLAQARNMGDLSENAEYTAAREELAFIDGRIDELEELLKQVTLISDNHTNNGHTIELGSRVQLKIDGRKEEFMVVGEWEADPLAKKISHQSPLGQALIGRTVGEKVEVAAPAGRILYTILSVH